MRIKKSNKKKKIVAFLAVVLFLSIGYAFLTTNLIIGGNTKISSNSWSVYFDHLEVDSGSVTATSPATINSSLDEVNFIVDLKKPGDYYAFSVDAVNGGTIDAVISNIDNTEIDEDILKFINYIVEYEDGTIPSVGDLLDSKQKKKINVKVEFKKDIENNDLLSTDTNLTLSLKIDFKQKGVEKIDTKNYLCKRATTLHTEVCNQTDSNYYCSGSGLKGQNITYGNLGTKGNLNSGDAFTCDINGDGIFDETTERFYYIATDNNKASLIYYTNIKNGNPTTNDTYMYDEDYNPYINGPVSLLSQLPSSDSWINIENLDTRPIKDELGTIKINSFDYSSYNARLLTTSEVAFACGITVGEINNGELDNCKFLLEKTIYSSNSNNNYGYWLENVSSINDERAWAIFTYGRTVGNFETGNDTEFGVRPVIEISMDDIAY